MTIRRKLNAEKCPESRQEWRTQSGCVQRNSTRHAKIIGEESMTPHEGGKAFWGIHFLS